MAKNKAKMNKFLTGAITATMVATAVAPVASAAAFTDLDRVDESVKAEIDNAVELGFFNDGTKFNPSAKITRGQAALTLARYIAGDQSVKAYAEANDLEDKVTAFKDVPASYKNGADFQQELYYASLIVKDAEAFTQTNLNPAGDVTRSQMAKIITETFDLKKVEGYESTITDIDHLDAGTKTFIETIASHGVTNVDTFNPAGHVTRSQMASFLVRSYDVVNPSVDAPEITGVSAINAKTAKVTFKNAVPANIDFSNFEVNGDLVVTDVKLSADRKSAEVTVNEEFTRNQEYTLTITGVLGADDQVYPDSSGKFTWEVSEGVVVALEDTTVDQGDKFGLTVKDAGGKDVVGAKVTAVSFNENILTSNASTPIDPSDVEFEAQKLAGTVDVEVKTELPDGSVLTNTFKVNVKDAVVSIANAGFTLVNPATDLDTAEADGTLYQLSNTAAFKAYATAKTSLVEGAQLDLYAFAETNGNPDITAIDWADADNPVKSVTTSNAIVLDANLSSDGEKVEVKGNSKGKAAVTVTFKDNTKKVFNIEVTETPKFKDIRVEKTAVSLSDESKGGYVEGVNQATILVDSINQFDQKYPEIPGEGFVTVTSSTDGIELEGVTPNPGKADRLTFTETDVDSGVYEGNLIVKALEGKNVKNATVTLSYFAKETDTKPTSVKKINVNVTDVDSTVDASALDFVLTHSEIDANAKNVLLAVDEIDFEAEEAFLLNSKGNRIGATTISSADLITTTDPNVETDTTVISFADEEAVTYLRDTDTVTVRVSDGTITKDVSIGYKNTAVVPLSAKVATKSVSIKVDADTYTLEDILFGIVDTEQLVLDDADTVNIAVKKNAKNAGYKYNQPLVSLTGTNGKALPFGTSLYGSTVTELEASTALWNNTFIQDVLQNPDANFAVDGFEYDLAVANVVSSGAGNTVDSDDKGEVKVTADGSVTFTLVVKGIYTEGSRANAEAQAQAHADRISAGTLTAAELKAASESQNLISAPVQFNVSVSGK